MMIVVELSSSPSTTKRHIGNVRHMDNTRIRNTVVAVVVGRHSLDGLGNDNMKEEDMDLAVRMVDSQSNRVVAVPCSHIVVVVVAAAAADGSVPKRHLVAGDNRKQPQPLHQLPQKMMRYLWDRSVPSYYRVVADDTKDIDMHNEMVDKRHAWKMTVSQKSLVEEERTWMQIQLQQQHPERKRKGAEQANIVVAPDLGSADETKLVHLLFWANSSANTKTKQ